jgi:hypothetical protein
LREFADGWKMVSMRAVIASLCIVPVAALPCIAAPASLSFSTVFVGQPKFDRLVERGMRENWRGLPIGERTTRVALALAGTPYKNYTLELHERIETPCVNMNGMDCWTFFEIALGTARALKVKEHPTARDLLAMIELDRYRGGKCDGSFVSRLHHLEDWQYDNQRRGLVRDVTPGLPGAQKIRREMNYMGGSGSRFFRQLRANPSLIPAMARIENDLSRRGIWYLPKVAVPAAESKIQSGDVISIVTTWPRSYTSHVGLAWRDRSGVLRFLHASRDKKTVLVDSRLSSYLARYGKHAGIMVARPNDVR